MSTGNGIKRVSSPNFPPHRTREGQLRICLPAIIALAVHHVPGEARGVLYGRFQDNLLCQRVTDLDAVAHER